MNIGIVVDNELNNDKRVLREAQILKDDGHKVFSLCFGFEGKLYDGIDGITVTRIYITRRLKNLLFFIFNTFNLYERLWSLWICRFIKIHNIDVIHAHDLYMAKCSHRGIKRSGRNISLILDLHENFSYQVKTYNWTRGILRNLLSFPAKWEKKEKEYLSYADKIIVLSDEFRDNLVSRYPTLKEENFCTFPNVPDVEQMNSFRADISKVQFRKKGPIIFYFGIVAERRGIFIALDCFTSLVKEGADIYFLIIGPVDKKDMLHFSKLTGSDAIKQRIIYIPWIDLSELPSYLEVSDMCIAPFLKNPQHESGVANKIFDYMLGKKPVIASDCLPQQKLIEKYECGIIYRNEIEMKEAVKKLMADPALSVRMGNNGYLAVINELNTGKMKDKLLLLYSNILKK